MSPRRSRRIATASFSLPHSPRFSLLPPHSRRRPPSPPAAPPSTRSRSRLSVPVSYDRAPALCAGHRSGRISLLGRAAAAAERVTGLPAGPPSPRRSRRVALDRPVRHVLGHLAPHRRRARHRAADQPGPLPDPGRPVRDLQRRVHRRRSSPASRSAEAPSDHPRLARAARRLLIAVGGAFALAGFPLDDVWHRLFGQDVTLWGPTHLMLIGGAVMTLIGLRGPARRGRARERARPGGDARPRLALQLRRGLAGGRPAGRPLDLPGRVRLRRPAVPPASSTRC